MGEPDMRLGLWTAAGALCALAVISCGCAGTARLVSRDSNSGVVAVPENSNRWPSFYRKHAEELMKANCPDGYTIVKEEEVVVGQTQHTHTTTDRSGSPLLAALHIDPINENSNQTTSYDDRKEWRIYYQAKGTNAASQINTPPELPAVH
jgi:hypothetical protein